MGYKPPDGYALDIEVYRVAELRRRAGDVEQRGFERADFHCLFYVTAGRYAHIVDFELHDCQRGSLIVLQPGQVHHFGDLSECDGWALILRSEVLPARAANAAKVSDIEAMKQLEGLPSKLALRAGAQLAATEAFERMARDAGRPASRAVNALLRSQLEALVIRLHIDSTIPNDAIAEPAQLQRFRQYRTLVEREFTRWHTVALYAAELGCSEKSLSRAARTMADRSAKAILTDRVVLEAKRLLAHSLLPVANIGYELGFSEPTNFVKFFRRETRLTPGAFRKQMSAGTPRPASNQRIPPSRLS
ncbi:MAG: helix-turn-helix domain-containing protein [Rhizobiales bacterium]|nr:helix-turn-helix domain-containing protein [Hyphomicrobiales bacterium]MBO6699604.1 helix-turn-helix domain-containing protein [Hyphomicrobiales bacterium]MBO6737142.1 helix-turn-helix domain-containing protein [Hyphomicrobiales bacterium]MBO6954721.1 helix-turn-helix domain-containing protein [Hyphomicrobiales bacterium]